MVKTIMCFLRCVKSKTYLKSLHILACAFKMHFYVALWKDLHTLVEPQ